MAQKIDLLAGATEQNLLDIQKYCLRNSQTVAFAESCTSGLVSAATGQIPGASKFFKGSVVSYSGEAKENLLRVKLPNMLCHGQVSEVVAKEMALGAQLALNSDWAVSVTGIAGPGGGTPEKPVGMVCFSCVGPGFEGVKTQHFKSGNRLEIQLESVRFAIQFLWDSIHA